MPEVVECHLMVGDCDFILRVMTADLAAYRRFQTEYLTRIRGVQSVKTDLPMQTTDLEGGLVEAGESVTGTVRITKPRGDTQLILSDLAGRNLTMLAIKG